MTYSFRAHKNGTDQTGIANHTDTPVTFGTVDFNDGSYYNASTGAWTPPAGKVHIDAKAWAKAGVLTAGNITNAIFLKKNGTNLGQDTSGLGGISTTSGTMTVDIEDVANGTDVYTISFYGTSDTTTTPPGTLTISGNHIHTYFSGRADGILSSLDDALAFLPVVNPSSGNVQAQGLSTQHQIIYSDANANFRADRIFLTSTDPSALIKIPASGSATAGNITTMTFGYSSTTQSVSYTSLLGDTMVEVAAGLVAAIKANASLYMPISSTNIAGGGLPGQILFAIASGSTINLDYDVRNVMTVTYSVTGSATEILTIPSPIPTALDGNPLIQLSRKPGVAPSPGSSNGRVLFSGSNSTDPTKIKVQYGSIDCSIVNSTSGSLQARMLIGACNPTTGTIDRGLYVSNGVYPPSVISGDMGLGTANFAGYYKNGLALPFQSSFISSNYAIIPGYTAIIYHPLGAMPTLVTPYIVCVTGEGGYGAGQIIQLQFGDQGNNRGLAAVTNSAAVGVIMGSDNNSISIIDNGGNSFPITNVNWLFFIKVFA